MPKRHRLLTGVNLALLAVCHPAPFYLDQQMHDPHLERFLKGEAGDGPIKSFTLRGIKDSPPYLHDGRCLTLEDTVEFFNLVLELKLTSQEKKDLVAFMRQPAAVTPKGR
jgi:cytochrome c peroxidase